MMKVGFFSLTGCQGCQLSLLFNEQEILSVIGMFDIAAFPFIKAVNKKDRYDVIFIEGLVASNEDAKVLKELRKITKLMVAMGACAHTGCIPAYRNFVKKDQYKHLLYKKDRNIQDTEAQPISKLVDVDFTLPGCPPSEPEILEFLKQVALGKLPRPYTDPVCVECKNRDIYCLLEKGKPCLGPITVGGCKAICPAGGLECWGCRGPTSDMNLKEMKALLKEKGFDDDLIEKRLHTFAGLLMKDADDKA